MHLGTFVRIFGDPGKGGGGGGGEGGGGGGAAENEGRMHCGASSTGVPIESFGVDTHAEAGSPSATTSTCETGPQEDGDGDGG